MMFRTYDDWKTTDDTAESPEGGYCDACGKRTDVLYFGTVSGTETFYCGGCAGDEHPCEHGKDIAYDSCDICEGE
jgi:hypothetical protein